MFEVLILVCSTSLPPAECQMNTAIDVIRGPVASSEIDCGLHGQAYFAETSLAKNFDGAYLKIRCARRSAPSAKLDTDLSDSSVSWFLSHH
jgi:hypothetical protein